MHPTCSRLLKLVRKKSVYGHWVRVISLEKLFVIAYTIPGVRASCMDLLFLGDVRTPKYMKLDSAVLSILHFLFCTVAYG